MTTETRYRLVVTGDLMDDTTAQDVAECVRYCGPQGVLIPGVTDAENVSVVASEKDPEQVTLTAELSAVDVLPEDHGDYPGEKIDEAFIADYINGADVNWLGSETRFFPFTAQATRIG